MAAVTTLPHPARPLPVSLPQRLHAIPKHSSCLRVSFPTVRAAAAAARDTVNGGVAVGRCELLDDVMVKIVNDTSAGTAPWPVKTTLMFELTGPSPRAGPSPWPLPHCPSHGRHTHRSEPSRGGGAGGDGRGGGGAARWGRCGLRDGA